MVVAIVDDVATSGGSSLKAVEAAERYGCRVACVIAMLDRLEGASAHFEAIGLPLHALCTIADLDVKPLEPHAEGS
jgi:orotate phosphoribosyltransferase